MPQELADLPEFPMAGKQVWDDFLDLHITRRSGLNGPERLSFADLYYWQKVTGVTAQKWAVRAIFKLDRVYMAQIAADREKV